MACLLLTGLYAAAQDKAMKNGLRFNLSDDGSRYLQFNVLNQTWLRFNQSNPGTLVEGKAKDQTFDIGLRRTRFQLQGQVTDKVFVYFQFGQNNFNSQYNTGNNRKMAAFFHDALAEYKVSTGNQLKIGAGLSNAAGVSRFSQPSASSMLTTDLPIFAMTTIDQTDEFSRRLSLYARGQIGHWDYRVVLSDPFPVTSNGSTPPALADYSTYAQMGHTLQQQAYLMYQFFEHENHTLVNMTGTYLGKKKIFNIAVGGLYHPDAMWKKGQNEDTVYQNLVHFAVESYLDMPLNKEKQSAISAYAGFFITDYGDNFLRYNAPMNTANGTSLNATNSITGQGFTYGNTYPMFGTGKVIYTQLGYLLPKGCLGLTEHRLLPYASLTASKFDRLNGLWCQTTNLGINYLLNGHASKFSLDWQNRPTFEVVKNELQKGKRKNMVVFQYQILF